MATYSNQEAINGVTSINKNSTASGSSEVLYTCPGSSYAKVTIWRMYCSGTSHHWQVRNINLNDSAGVNYEITNSTTTNNLPIEIILRAGETIRITDTGITEQVEFQATALEFDLP